ncbi:MAG TPA: DoxX family protein [Rummeliibacillus sp.]|nr:DoxX family protein [Rummeliibacillus sp.]
MDIFMWILQGFLALVFIYAGLGKIFGSTMHKNTFTHLKLPQWFRVITGLVETVAVAFLIVGYWYEEYVFWGALLITAVGIGGVISHMRVNDSGKVFAPIAILGLLGLVLASISF